MIHHKEAIADVVAKSGQDVLSTASGRFLAMNIDASGYISNKSIWRKRIGQKRERKDTFLKDMEIGDDFASLAADQEVAAQQLQGQCAAAAADTQDVFDAASNLQGAKPKRKKIKHSIQSEDQTNDDSNVKGLIIESSITKKKHKKKIKIGAIANAKPA